MNVDDSADAGAGLDPGVLTDLREAMDDDELLAEVIQTFLDETPAHLATLRAAVAAGDDAAAAAVAHLVKGSALTLGAVRLGATCTDVEAAPAAPLAESATVEFDEVARHLGRFLAGLDDRP